MLGWLFEIGVSASSGCWLCGGGCNGTTGQRCSAHALRYIPPLHLDRPPLGSLTTR